MNHCVIENQISNVKKIISILLQEMLMKQKYLCYKKIFYKNKKNKFNEIEIINTRKYLMKQENIF